MGFKSHQESISIKHLGRKSVKITTWLWRLWKRFCLSDSSSHHVTPGFMTFHYSLIQYSSCSFVLHFKIVRFIIGLVWDPKLFLEWLVLCPPCECFLNRQLLEVVLPPSSRHSDYKRFGKDHSHNKRAWTPLQSHRKKIKFGYFKKLQNLFSICVVRFVCKETGSCSMCCMLTKVAAGYCKINRHLFMHQFYLGISQAV